MGVTLALASMLCFAANILLTRHAVAYMSVESGFFIVLAVNLVATLSGYGIELALREAPAGFNWVGAGWFALAGVFGTWLGRRLLFDTVKLIGPARASIFHSSAPVFALLAAWLILGEKLGELDLLLMVVVIGGLWISQLRAAREGAPLQGARLWRGVLLGFLTVAGFGLGNALRGIALRVWYEPLLGTLVSVLAALALVLLTTRDWGRVRHGWRQGGRTGYLLYGAAGLATTAGSVFVAMAMVRMEIALAALVTHTTPLVIFPFSVLVYRNREMLTLPALAGTALVLAGITLLALR